jgi:hypothetical protein
MIQRPVCKFIFVFALPTKCTVYLPKSSCGGAGDRDRAIHHLRHWVQVKMHFNLKLVFWGLEAGRHTSVSCPSQIIGCTPARACLGLRVDSATRTSRRASVSARVFGVPRPATRRHGSPPHTKRAARRRHSAGSASSRDPAGRPRPTAALISINNGFRFS